MQTRRATQTARLSIDRETRIPGLRRPSIGNVQKQVRFNVLTILVWCPVPFRRWRIRRCPKTLANEASRTSSQKPDDQLYQQFKQNFPQISATASSSGAGSDESNVADIPAMTDIK